MRAKKILPIILLLSCILIIFYYSSMTVHKSGKMFLHSDIPTSIPGLTPVQEAGTKVDFSTLFDGCIDLGTGAPLTFNDLTLGTLPYDVDEPYIAYDHVQPNFPLLIDKNYSGKHSILYDLYFYNGPLRYCYSADYNACLGYTDPTKYYCLKIVKNSCRLSTYQGVDKCNLSTDCSKCWFIYARHEQPDQYYAISGSLIKRGNMTQSIIKDDIAEYEIEIINPVEGSEEDILKKVILEVDISYEYKPFAVRYVHVAFDADQLRTVSK